MVNDKTNGVIFLETTHIGDTPKYSVYMYIRGHPCGGKILCFTVFDRVV